jgi:GTP pyrophosphokinase
VKTLNTWVLDDKGQIDSDAWVLNIKSMYRGVDLAQLSLLEGQLHTVKELGLSVPTDFNQSAFQVGLQMAAVLGELNADIEALCAALWFQILLHGGISRENLLKKTTPSIAALVEGALNLKVSTAFSGLLKKDLTQMDRLRKMFLTMVNDARVVLVKLAERMVALRLSKGMDPQRRLGLAESSLYIYSPLANRLGIGQLKWELEDRAFAVIDPIAYQQITQAIQEKRIAREAYVDEFLTHIRDALKDMGILAEATGRVKHLYSIYRKMVKKNLPFDQLFDLRAIRILVKDVRACYEVLGFLHEQYQPLWSEFTDYIAMPKPNGYRSIHTVIEGPQEKLIEVQIRTFAMHEESEMGVAAHWRYKEGVGHDANDEARIAWLRSLLEWQDHLGETLETPSSGEVQTPQEIAREALRNSMREAHIYVFTPEGDVLDLESQSTPVDFAYRVHTEVGHRCRGAKVNGRIVPLTYELRTGDRVEILTGKESRPSRDWVRKEAGFVKSAHARQKISAWFRQQQPKIEPKTEVKNEEKPEVLPSLVKPPRPKSTSADLTIGGENNLLFKMAGCCRPILGDAVGGYITQGRGVSVHREDCKSFVYLSERQPHRVLTVSWGEASNANYVVELHLEAIDRTALLKDITNVLVGEKLSIVNLRSHVDSDGLAKVILTFMVREKGQLSRVTHLLSALPKVISVARR